MTYGKSSKQFVVDVSSSDESTSPPSESDDDVAEEEISSSTSCNDDDDWSERSYSEDQDDFHVGGGEEWDVNDVDKPDAESMCKRVIQFIRGLCIICNFTRIVGKNDLQELKVDECKAYLRMHRLRISGTKEECIERIKEHWKLKDKNGEIYYPRSSFIVDCTGDVCKGDVVLFHQKVHQISGTTARNKTVGRRNVGRRTVAGRIVKESYGATRQQHTFTVEVLWSTGTKKLEPLFPLLVKGRNLYKLKTFRQLWKNEKDRLEVLAEKHRRGNDARNVRAMRRTKAIMRKNEPSSSAHKGTQHCKRSHNLGPSRTRETSPGRKNYPNVRGKMGKNKKRIPSHRFAPYNSKESVVSRDSVRHRGYQNSPDYDRQPPALYYNYPAQAFNHYKSDVFPAEPDNLHPHGDFSSKDRSPYSRPLPCSSARPSSKWKETSDGCSRHPGYSHSMNENESVSFNYSRSRGSHHSLYSNSTSERRRR